ncbi:hypothetical protein BDCR2A_01930 [Borrelia duttonii CR2A]|uniref:Uncharacterized protein n=1 Tax=Borrelia duttonii CR2A TaxID=1432657 RepID=W6TEW6_9SPIR|nr:hypothetical protein BDCR2A_01930 [Borrelia duttonii CR2A]
MIDFVFCVFTVFSRWTNEKKQGIDINIKKMIEKNKI